jgi:hypothetical protein
MSLVPYNLSGIFPSRALSFGPSAEYVGFFVHNVDEFDVMYYGE